MFDRSRLRLKPLSEREHDLDLGAIRALEPVACEHPALETVAARILAARQRGASVVLMMGAHVLRAGVQRYLIDMMERGWLSVVATNGASLIHDYELAAIGATTESVARYIQSGEFGLWKETGRLNDIVRDAARDGLGAGEAVGRAIQEAGLPHRDLSLLAAAYRIGVPVTAHVSIGFDIVHEHPNCDGAAWGATSYRDFLRFTGLLEGLEGGVVMNLGSAVMGPEVYLKALAMVRNVAAREGREIRHFTTLVTDLYPLPTEIGDLASRDVASYYFRPWKTLLVRSVADGGEAHYVRGSHGDVVPQLWTALDRAKGAG